MMLLALSALFFAFLGWQQIPGGPVPVAKEPRHHLVAENPVVRIYDVVVPPGESTLFHVHDKDYFFVNFGAAELKSQAEGKPEEDLNLADGEIRYTPAVVTHRIRNAGKRPFHNLTVEILQPPGLAASSTMGRNQALVLENNRLRAIRTLLPAGQSTGMHAHPSHTLVVMVDGGSIRIDTPNGRPEVRSLKSGDFIWLDSAVGHSLTNTGNAAMQIVEIEVK